MSQLVANSEYTVMRASGMSLAQVAWSVVRVGIPLAVATFLAGEYVAPPAERIAQTVRSRARRRAPRRRAAVRVRILVQAGPHVRQHPHGAGRHEAVGVRIYEFDDDLRAEGRAHRRIGSFAGDGTVEARAT